MNEHVSPPAVSFSPCSWNVRIVDGMQARSVRSSFRDHIARYALPDSDVASAELIFAELFANVVRHAPGPAHASLSWDDLHPTLLFTDEGAGFSNDPCLTFDEVASESGRGLAIIRALAVSLAFGNRPVRGAFVRVVLPIERRPAAP